MASKYAFRKIIHYKKYLKKALLDPEPLAFAHTMALKQQALLLKNQSLATVLNIPFEAYWEAQTEEGVLDEEKIMAYLLVHHPEKKYRVACGTVRDMLFLGCVKNSQDMTDVRRVIGGHLRRYRLERRAWQHTYSRLRKHADGF